MATACDVILMIGQSNAWGFPNLEGGFSWPGSSPDAELNSAITDVYLWQVHDTPNSFAAYTPNTYQLDPSEGTKHYFSWDVRVAIDQRDSRGLPQFVLKLALGGTSIVQDQVAKADWHDGDGNNTNEARESLKRKIDEVKRWLGDNGYEPTFTLCLWDQGETDGGETTAVYQRELTKLIRQTRYWTGNLKLQWIIREVTNASTVTSAVTAIVAADSRVYKTTNTGTANVATGDGVHFTGDGLWTTIGGQASTIATGLTYP